MTGSAAEVLSGARSWSVDLGDCVDLMRTLPDASIDAIVSDPIYPEIDRHYGRISEADWHVLMRAVVAEARRVLKPSGSAVFILQPNSERVGRMRPWLWEFMAWTAREWNQVQDAWWWNFAALPSGGATHHGLMRGSAKACVWLGDAGCYRDQESVLWAVSESFDAHKAQDRLLRSPSGRTVNKSRMKDAVAERGGVTPFNVLPIENGDKSRCSGSQGHGAGTPYDLAAWWIRYICPPGGVVLDPFGGAGTMAEAARDQGRRCILFEQDPESIPRCHATMERTPRGMQGPEMVSEKQLSIDALLARASAA